MAKPKKERQVPRRTGDERRNSEVLVSFVVRDKATCQASVNSQDSF